MNKILYRLIIISTILLTYSNEGWATDFYWKTVGKADQNYTNSANWESAPGSGVPANGSLAPSSVDDVYFPAGNLLQTISVSVGAAGRNINIQSSGVITLAGIVNVYGDFISNGRHLFSNGMTFLGAGNHKINMGDNLSKTSATTGGDFVFSGTGTYTLLSDLNLPRKSITITNSSFVANGYWVQVGYFGIANTATGTKIVNLANSKLSVNAGASNSGALVFSASPASTTYNFTNAELYINQASNSTFINTGNAVTNGTVINGIKSITFTETTPGIAAEHIRCSTGPFTLGVAQFNLNVSAFNITGGGRLNINASSVNLIKPVDITSNGITQLIVNAINEAASCVGQSSIRSEGSIPIAFEATAPITTSNIGFKSIAFSGSTFTMPVNNDLGLNTGTYTTTATTTTASRSFYWVGGTGNWNDPTKWSLLGSGGAAQAATGCLPNYNDDVYFDGNSFAASGQTVTITGSGSAMAYARNVYWTDPNYRGKLTGGTLNIKGSADYSGSTGVASNLVYVGFASHTIKSGTHFTYASSSIQFFGTGSYTLTDDLIAGTGTFFQLSAGTFNSNGKAITAARFNSSSVPFLATNVRSINLANSVLTFTWGNVGGNSPFVLSTPFLGSFNAGGSSINITGLDAEFYINGYVNNGTVTLANLAFNDINFTALTGNPLFSHSGVLNFSANNVNFSSNGRITQMSGTIYTHRVNDYNLTAGKVYTFASFTSSSAPIYTVLNSINSNSIGSCSPKVTLQSSNAGSRVKLYKASLPFTIDNVMLKDINASGVALTVPGGEDLGNNLNVNITPNPSQNFYWVGGTGNWNEPTNWSIGVSGGNPTITNINNCIPALVDNVFFDGNSFTANNQTVTIDNNAFCRNMHWDNMVSARTPVFAGGNFNLYTYGSVTLAPNMTFPFVGNWVMRGNSLATNANAITTNEVFVRSLLLLDGGGRYDFLDNFSSSSNIRFPSGQFYANGKNIVAASLSLSVTGTNYADISNSVITLNGTDGTNTYIASHSSISNWNATGSTINVNVRGIPITTPTGVTIDYGTMNVNQSTLATLGSGSGTLRFKNLNFLRATSSMSGRFIIGNLSYTTSSNNQIGSGSLITVTNKLTANGTPCNPIRFTSNTPGTPATFISTLCNFDIKFARLTDITAGSTCTAAQNKVIGDDAGGNSNWTFATISAFQYLGADKVLKCNEYPYTLSTASFNQDATSILWSTGATTPEITVTGPGTYSVTVTYGAGCNLTDAITLGLTPSPVLAATTIYACETSENAGSGTFNLHDADALLVATPSDYTISYFLTAADALAASNPLGNSYLSNSAVVYVRVVETATGCVSTRDVILTVRAKILPIAPAFQKICATVNTSLANLTITGTDIKWYADAVSTTVLPGTTLLVSDHTYYATQTINNGCESARIPVTVKLENCAIANPAIRSRVGE